LDDEILAKMMEEIRQSMSPYGTHGFEHVERVYNTCLQLGRVEKADMKILLPAALLHDFARGEENHAKASAEKARLLLRIYGYSQFEIEKITNAISTHSFSGNKFPETLEGKILSDADKLDALGALGVYRTAVYSGEHSRPVNDFIAHFYNKLFKLERLLFTTEAKRMAEERTKYMGAFVNRLKKELKQEI
jgi:uncharacterized protein